MTPFDAEVGFDTLWERHESPSSVWWFVLMYPVLVLTLYRRSPTMGFGLLGSLAVNLLVVSPPESDAAWATRVVRGERVWLDEGLLSSKPTLLFTAVGGAVNLYTLRAARRRQPVRTTVGTVGTMVLMVLFFDRMAGIYETSKNADCEDERAIG